MTRPSLSATAVAVAATVLAVGLGHLVRQARLIAPAAGDPSWQWAGAAPGMNVYFAIRSEDHSDVFAWVDQRFFSNPAGIAKDLVELRQFNCLHRTSRRLPSAASSLTPGAGRDVLPWTTPRSGTAAARVLALVCHQQDSAVITARLLGP
jgi:hypothetical protein